MPTLSQRAGLFARAAAGPFMPVTTCFSSISLMRAAGLAAALALAASVAGCGDASQQTAGGAPPPPAVTVAKPTQRTLSDYDEYVGRFTAVDSVEIRAR